MTEQEHTQSSPEGKRPPPASPLTATPQPVAPSSASAREVVVPELARAIVSLKETCKSDQWGALGGIRGAAKNVRSIPSELLSPLTERVANLTACLARVAESGAASEKQRLAIMRDVMLSDSVLISFLIVVKAYLARHGAQNGDRIHYHQIPLVRQYEQACKSLVSPLKPRVVAALEKADREDAADKFNQLCSQIEDIADPPVEDPNNNVRFASALECMAELVAGVQPHNRSWLKEWLLERDQHRALLASLNP